MLTPTGLYCKWGEAAWCRSIAAPDLELFEVFEDGMPVQSRARCSSGLGGGDGGWAMDSSKPSRPHSPANPRPPLVRAPSPAVPEATNTLTSQDAYRACWCALSHVEVCSTWDWRYLWQREIVFTTRTTLNESCVLSFLSNRKIGGTTFVGLFGIIISLGIFCWYQ